MHAHQLNFVLPAPWSNKSFSASHLGTINFLVGPNGSGKSRFASALKQQLQNARLLGTDRLAGMEQSMPLRNIFGDHFASGLAKGHFANYKSAGQQGMGIDTIVLLEERTDLRIQVEATLSHLFDRKIRLEWDSGHLQAFASVGATGTSYRLDRDECHGIKELFVLLTHLYNDEHPYLIIDEPELNLHPQYQAFFLQEVRKIAGIPSPGTNRKVIFLITHSPFILDFRSIDDVKSVISFSATHSVPRQLLDLDAGASERLGSLVPRLNVHHKQLFFSDNPIFVEGTLDSQLVANVQEARGVSVAGADSCVIDAGGCEEVNRYLELCLLLGKTAHFIYDLDSLFSGNLRACIRGDNEIQGFLAAAGVGSDFSKYCGELDRTLTKAIDKLLACDKGTDSVQLLVEYLRSLGPRQEWQSSEHAKGRTAILTAISRTPANLVPCLDTSEVSDLQGRIGQISKVLQAKRVHLLTGGTLERYLPSYTGNPFKILDEQKRAAVVAEIGYLAASRTESELRTRYNELFDVICRLPGKVSVDIDRVLKDYLSRYIHEIQSALVANPQWTLEQLQTHLQIVQRSTSKVFSVASLARQEERQFTLEVIVAPLLGEPQQVVEVTHKTNAGMGEFSLKQKSAALYLPADSKNE